MIESLVRTNGVLIFSFLMVGLRSTSTPPYEQIGGLTPRRSPKDFTVFVAEFVRIPK